jgi:photosystem II stability/assembly factor-like uncharacterized protein
VRVFMMLMGLIVLLGEGDAMAVAVADATAAADSPANAGAAGAAGAADASPAALSEGIEIDSTIFGALQARCLGPAVMGGRIAALDAVASDPRTVYVGAAGGGVWKSTNGGVNFKPVFDDHCQSIGAICIDQAHPDTVWVGTGETWVRNSVSIGDGIYKSVNGGESWTRAGLVQSERIGKIIVSPRDPNVVYAAALGHLWDANEERGLFKTTDGGETWQKILYVGENTGCADVAFVPGMPNIVFAAMWEFRRRPDSFHSGGPGSGLYRSIDGGKSWQKLTEGLPEPPLGRIAVAVSPTLPSRIYASVESTDSGFYRSDDMGETWTRTNDERGVTGRPFYFSLVMADPQDPERVYKPGYVIYVSRDGGKTFSGVGGWVHVDYHAMWIDPADPAHIYVGNDGGVYVTYNRGGDWHHLHSLPVSQFYRVSVDDARPYNVYGGLQDNGAWRGPSQSPGGIENADWENIGGGDGFCVMRDPLDPDIVYSEWQGGNLARNHLLTGDSKDIKPEARPGEPEYRYNWNAPAVLSPTDPARLYIGSQFLLRSTDRGDSWTRISNDLTTNDPDKQRQEESGGLTVDNTSAENHCTIYTICESPLDKRVIWVGTDDGNVQVTGDDGHTWQNVTANITDLPSHTWVSCIEAGRHDRSTAYATFDGHRAGDMMPHVYKTTDLGRSWQAIATDELTGYAHVIRQDPVNPNLLFLGTEFGLFITVDGGRHWAHYKEDFPPVPVMDLVIHAAENDLVIGTHGRGIWIMDDYQPLRQLTRAGLAQDVFLLQSPPAFQVTQRGKQHSPGDSYFVAGNPSQTARIIYYLKKRHMFGDMKIEIFDPDGELLKTLPGGKRLGINLVRWRMRLKPPKVTASGVLDPYTSFAGAVGPMAPEGTYTYKLTKGKEEYGGTIEVIPDPNSPHSAEDRALQQRTVMQLYQMIERISYVAEALKQARDDARERADGLPAKDKLRKRLESFADEAEDLRETIVVPDEEIQGIPGIRKLRENLIRLYAAIAQYSGRPGENQLERIPYFEQEILNARTTFEELIDKALPSFNEQLSQQELEPIQILSEEEFKERDS